MNTQGSGCNKQNNHDELSSFAALMRLRNSSSTNWTSLLLPGPAIENNGVTTHCPISA